MKISGVIVEYNPMHNGHIFHLEKTRELCGSDVVIAVMSGNFAQRGIPSIIDKWTKTSIALNSGVDIVLELPSVYSLSSAEFFSFGAVSLLNSLGCVDSICFGSECGDISFLKDTAAILESEPHEFKIMLKEELDKGLPFPKARALALEHYLKSNANCTVNDISSQLNSSNNILSIEYLKSLKRLDSSITAHTLKREGGSYNSQNLDSSFSSATSIRKSIKSGFKSNELMQHMPKAAYDTLCRLDSENYSFAFPEMIFPYIKYKALVENALEDLRGLPDVSEGLENKIIKSLIDETSYESCIDSIKSKRYAQTRISRILCQYFLGFYKYDTDAMRRQSCPYARLLGFNEKGAAALKTIKSNSAIPIYSKLPKDINDMLALDLNCTRAYSLLNNSINPNQDFLTSPIIIKK